MGLLDFWAKRLIEIERPIREVLYQETGTATAITIVPDTIYIVENDSAMVVFTLPVTFPSGKIFGIFGKGMAGWKVVQGTGQFIRYTGGSTTSGPTGYLQNNTRYDLFLARCITANTEFILYINEGPIIKV